VSRLKFGVVSCNNYEAGFFNAFGKIAERQDLDAVLHLGDYIYEYPGGFYGDSSTNRFHQNFETITRSQYRARYSLYRLDPKLRAAHQQHVFINIWDDHESANDAWQGGAQNHDPNTEGPWAQRRAIATDVFFEWLPIRDNAVQNIYRSFPWGDLVDLIMLDTRLLGREEQINDVTDTALYDTNRTILGAAQRGWFTNELKQSNARWRVVGNQVVFAQLQLGWAGLAQGQTPQQVESLFLDIWDGYPAERQKIIRFLKNGNIDNTIFVTGDFHCSFAFDIADTVVDEANNYASVPNYNGATGVGSKAVEFVTPSISSANFDENVDLTTAQLFQSLINNPLPAPFPPNNPNPHLKYVDLIQHGYFVLDLRPDSAKANYYYTPILNNSNQEQFGRALKVLNGANHLEFAVESSAKAVLDVPAPNGVLNGPVYLKEETYQLFSLYPNPARKSLFLQVGSQYAQQLKINIYDLQGKLVLSLPDNNIPEGILELQIPVEVLPKGAYFLKLRAGGYEKAYPFQVY
jgi:alkaline phosphatase D